MSREIYEYEVTLKLTNRNTKAATLSTRIEHAYSVGDAVMQACMNQSAQVETGSAEIALVSVGPPAEAIRKATVKLAEQIQAVLSELTKKVKAKA